MVAETLVPKVMVMDEKGRPIGESPHDVKMVPKHPTVETIPWSTWLEKEVELNPIHRSTTAKIMFWMNHEFVHRAWNTRCPIAVIRKAFRVCVLTTETLRSKELVVPLFVKRLASVVAEDAQTCLHPNSVSVVVSWPKKDIEIDKDEEEVRLNVQPEVKLPALDADGSTLTWKPSDAAHPFWVIKRDADHSEANA